MTSNVLVSIVVPIYNTEKYISNCLQSISNQTYKNIEVLLIDDGSTDHCHLICDIYAKRDPRFVVIHKENGGLISAWTEGVKASQGDYLCFVDSDDWIEENMIEEMLQNITGIRNELVCSDIIYDRNGKKMVECNQLQEGVYERDSLENIKSQILGNEKRYILVSRCAKLFSRQLIMDNIRYCDRNIGFGEDMNITIPVILDCARIVVVRQSFYHYVQRDGSMTHQYDKYMYKNVLLLKKIIAKIMQEKCVANGIQQVDREYIFLLLFVLKNELRGNDNCIQTIRDICMDAENRSLIKQNYVSVDSLSNKLIYAMMRHPNRFFVIMSRILIKIYDNKNY